MDWQPRRLQQWMQSRALLAEDFSVKRLPGGLSNEVYLVRSGARRWLLRRPPLQLSHQAAHNVLREYHVIEALSPYYGRLPRLLAASNDLSVMGTPFFLMDCVDGVLVNERLPELYQLVPDSHAGFGEQLIDALLELHAIDWRKAGLASLASALQPEAEHFLAQQIDRWWQQFQSGAHSPHHAALARVTEALRRQRPLTTALTVIHGDYRLDNVLFSHQPPARAIAVIDWEMTTIGDPLLDLASALVFWPEADNEVAVQPARRRRKSQRLQLPSAASLAQRYAAASGRDLGQLDYYCALVLWKRAIVLSSRMEVFAQNTIQPQLQFALEKYLGALVTRAGQLLPD